MCSVYEGRYESGHPLKLSGVSERTSNDEAVTFSKLVHHSHLRSQVVRISDKTLPSARRDSLPVSYRVDLLEDDVLTICGFVKELNELDWIDEIHRVKVGSNDAHMEHPGVGLRAHRDAVVGGYEIPQRPKYRGTTHVNLPGSAQMCQN